jgi:hypothetical protein
MVVSCGRAGRLFCLCWLLVHEADRPLTYHKGGWMWRDGGMGAAAIVMMSSRCG